MPGPKLAIPAGDGEKTRITIALGADLLDKLRQRRPGLSDQDLVVRATCWAAVGEGEPVKFHKGAVLTKKRTGTATCKGR